MCPIWRNQEEISLEKQDSILCGFCGSKDQKRKNHFPIAYQLGIEKPKHQRNLYVKYLKDKATSLPCPDSFHSTVLPSVTNKAVHIVVHGKYYDSDIDVVQTKAWSNSALKVTFLGDNGRSIPHLSGIYIRAEAVANFITGSVKGRKKEYFVLCIKMIVTVMMILIMNTSPNP